ncbi:hypothetical protein TSAR_013231, partial [Trichomalopsis sarcophagae]
YTYAVYLLLTVVYGAGNEGRHVEELGKCTTATGRILTDSYALGDAAHYAITPQVALLTTGGTKSYIHQAPLSRRLFHRLLDTRYSSITLYCLPVVSGVSTGVHEKYEQIKQVSSCTGARLIHDRLVRVIGLVVVVQRLDLESILYILGTTMADADANKELDSARKKSGRTSFHSEQFTYTWIIEEYSKCQSEQYSLEIVSPKIVVNQSNHIYEFKLSICPLRSDPIRGSSNTCIDLKVLTCPSDQTDVRVKLCFIRNDGTECNPISAIVAIKKNAVFQNYCVAPSTVYSKCLSNGNITIRCTFTFCRSVSRDKPEYSQLDAAKSIHDEFAELLYSGKFSDLTLDLGEKKFKVHKSILAARSPVFSGMFEHEMLENKENVVRITDVEPDIMSEILLFIYANKVNRIKELTAGIFAAADKYQLEALRLMCEDVFLETLSLDNLTEILQIVDQYETCPRLHDGVLQFLSINGSEVANWKNFDNVMQTLSPALLFEITKATMLKS